MKAVVFGGAEIKDYAVCKPYLDGAYVVCCDGGLSHAKALGILPDCIVGDFDSAKQEVVDFFLDKKIPVRTFPTHKDETDMELGLDAAMEAGATEVVIFGGIGSRLDHTLANVHYLLYLLRHGVKAKLVNEHNVVQLTDGVVQLEGKAGDLVSTLPLSPQVTGITTKGLEYPLTDATLTLDDRLIAVSNVMLSSQAEISVQEGYLLVMQCRD